MIDSDETARAVDFARKFFRDTMFEDVLGWTELKPIILIVTLFSVIFTFADFQLVYVLTHGGPQNATHLFATYAFDIAMGAGQLGLGASVALTMLPALALLIVALTFYLRRA
jgi:multiple sugar transport system permease protein